MALLSSADYPTVRAALDVKLTAATLADATIALPIYLGAAEAEIVRRDPLAASRTGAALQHVKNACVLLCAALLAPAMPSLTGEDIGSYAYTRKAIDWPARAAELRLAAERELAAVLTPATVTTASRPTMFAVAAGGRGW